MTFNKKIKKAAANTTWVLEGKNIDWSSPEGIDLLAFMKEECPDKTLMQCKTSLQNLIRQTRGVIMPSATRHNFVQKQRGAPTANSVQEKAISNGRWNAISNRRWNAINSRRWNPINNPIYNAKRQAADEQARLIAFGLWVAANPNADIGKMQAENFADPGAFNEFVDIECMPGVVESVLVALGVPIDLAKEASLMSVGDWPDELAYRVWDCVTDNKIIIYPGMTQRVSDHVQCCSVVINVMCIAVVLFY